jgi:hypothetical protein
MHHRQAARNGFAPDRSGQHVGGIGSGGGEQSARTRQFSEFAGALYQRECECRWSTDRIGAIEKKIGAYGMADANPPCENRQKQLKKQNGE